MESRYTPGNIEAKWYAAWEAAKAFAPKGEGKSFTIVIPPPNVTGALHMGHALNNTLQDVLIRFKRLQGYRTLWQPGTDHAGIATQSVVERGLQKEGKSKHDLGREKFIERVWEWKHEYGGRIVDQLKRMGCSCDWDRMRFTMDEGLSVAVREVFVRLHEQGLIYRGARLTNWCPQLQTALADEEVESKETKGHFWSIRYLLEGDDSQGIVVSTTRPETLFGDVAIAVHAEDERYQHLIGKRVLIPIIGRAIPIIADEHADPTKGTGAVKITPAHDFNDYEVGKRHGLKPVIVLGLDARLNQEAGPYAGLDRFVARKKLVAELEQNGQLVAVEDRMIAIPTCYRSGDVVEPTLLSQWYVHMKPLAIPALEVVAKGETRFVPERYTKTYNAWLEPFRDWCISRQLWWGHQIPVWYVISATEGKVTDATPYVVARNEADALAQAKAARGPDCVLKQEEDVLDTWFSSALWPFSTLGWPENTPDLNTFYPTDVLITARDIIYFWVARMIFSGMNFLGKTPFHTVYIHGTILDEKGQRMSKSKGNGIDPIEMIEQFGADAMRFALLTLTTEGQDIKLSPTKFESGRNFANKLWNAARFVHPHIAGNLVQSQSETTSPALNFGLTSDQLTLPDRWILARLSETVKAVTEALEPPTLRFSDAALALYRFTWDDFCSTYLELRKKAITGEAGPEKTVAVSIFVTVLSDLLALLHPFIPFITEEIWSHLQASEAAPEGMLISHHWPQAKPAALSSSDSQAMEGVLAIVEAVRQIRGSYGLGPNQALTVLVQIDDAKNLAALQPHLPLVGGLERIENLQAAATVSKPPFAAATLIPGGKIYVPLQGILEPEAERQRISKELEKAKGFVVMQEKKLQNEKFVAGAPEDVVAAEREKLGTQQDRVRKLEAALTDIG
jgi:valyl-tRNA synthetase